LTIFDLPTQEVSELGALAGLIASRRSVRKYENSPISVASLSQLLWSAQGITGPEGKRATPSAGGLYPLQLHILVRRVSELEPGIYNYDGGTHSLGFLNSLPEDGLKDMAIGDQPWLNEAAIVIGIAANIESANSHFESQPPQGERGSRYVYMESGALAQNVHLQATDLGLGCVLVAGFHDSLVKEMLGCVQS
jgi:SagB-type dehydrogenase family enzyme